MSSPGHSVRFSFQTKVLLPVLGALVILPVITLWVVNRSMTKQVEAEARQTLNTAEAVFRQTIDFRARDLLTRFRYAVNEPSYRSIPVLLGSNDPLARKEIGKFLGERLKDYGDDYDALIVTTPENASHVAVRPGTTDEPDGWIGATAVLTRAALQGQPVQGTLEFRGHVYLAVAVPVTSLEGDKVAGALTVTTRVSEAMLQELRSLTGAEILLIADDTVTASTLHQPELPALLPNLLKPDATAVIHQEHYLALSNSYERHGAQGGFRYVLLSSYEQRLRELQSTRGTLLIVSVAGVLLSALSVWFLIRRITHPLVELRDHAEAVGRGDFTRRITHFSNDECGAVAVAFNDMTGNLQASRADLEKAVGTLKTTQAQLIQSEKLSAVGQFVAGVAHELNNPLTSVIGFSELLQATTNDPKEKEHLTHIVRNALRCHKIVHSLLGFSRQHEPERKPLRLDEVAEAVLEIVSYDMRVNNVALVREYDSELPRILGDTHQLQQVVLNIVSNARQALETFRRDGQITLRTGANGDKVWLRIIDNGPGISAENLKRIFDPFFTTKPQGKGTGLGLSLSYGIVQEHRGTIRAESRPGVGTEFILEFPATQAGPASVLLFRPDSKAPVPTRPASLHLLVVDDEESILRLVQEILSTEGHRVEATGSGEAALELILRNQYDVIVSDWKMPGLNGMNLYHELLARKPDAARRMLFMTGDVIKDSFQLFLKQHNRTCLPKPFALREFHAAVAAILRPPPRSRPPM